MPNRDEGFIETLVELPPWVALIVASVAYIGMRFVLPTQLTGPFFVAIGNMIASLSEWVALFFVLIAASSAIYHRRRRALLDGRKDISTIRDLSWRGLEVLVGEAYRRDGYSVTGNSGPGSDGGVDLIVRKDGETILVQCKQWKARKVGVRTVREMFGLLNSTRANEVHVITSGYFTNQAKSFAGNKPIRLIDGPMLFQLVKKSQAATPAVDHVEDVPAVVCPKCGSSMVMRTAKKGKNAGTQFWGCERFPTCRTIINIGQI